MVYSPSYILPIQGLQRLEKFMDEYVGGISAHYTRCSARKRVGLVNTMVATT
jgi:hypothetical protein